MTGSSSLCDRLQTPVHQAVLIHMWYHYLILDHSDITTIFLDTATWSVLTEMVLNAIVGAFVQSYLVYRIHKLGSNILISMFNFLGVSLSRYEYILSTKSRPLMTAILGVGMSLSVPPAADAIIAAFLMFYLYQKRTGFRRSNDIISKLMIVTVSTGGLTTCVALAGFVAYFVAPLTFWDLFFSFMLSKLDATSLLIMLNTRKLISGNYRTRSEGTRTGEINSIPLIGLGLKGFDEDPSKGINIMVSQTTVFDDASGTKHSLVRLRFKLKPTGRNIDIFRLECARRRGFRELAPVCPCSDA
ncbi:hypothetical protein NM688_g6723 [Phlebia brevispora]|uniref:Uncharacterized protein n=1 Tax=Phlebia brevispora TaxID=194682 RepID=A0ACC1SD45_9APHY|nr:hypothetical protein NM688_g6723 [Phlebia brevispora]